jgi:hypothetical protein
MKPAFSAHVMWDSYFHGMAHWLFMVVKGSYECRSYQANSFMSSVAPFVSRIHENKSLYQSEKKDLETRDKNVYFKRIVNI